MSRSNSGGGGGDDGRRKSSISAEELAPIVMSQLAVANKRKEESRRQRRGGGNGSGANNNAAAAASAAAAAGPRGYGLDSGSESCGEEGRRRTAEAFMSGIQSALGDSNSSGSAAAGSAADNNSFASGSGLSGGGSSSGLSSELVSEVDLVLSKLMSSVNQDDPKLIPLISSLQASLKDTVDSGAAAEGSGNKKRVTLAQTKQQNLGSSTTSTTSSSSAALTPSTPGSAGGVGGAGGEKDWMKDPFGSLPKKPKQPATSLQHQGATATEFAPAESKTFDPYNQVGCSSFHLFSSAN